MDADLNTTSMEVDDSRPALRVNTRAATVPTAPMGRVDPMTSAPPSGTVTRNQAIQFGLPAASAQASINRETLLQLTQDRDEALLMTMLLYETKQAAQSKLKIINQDMKRFGGLMGEKDFARELRRAHEEIQSEVDSLDKRIAEQKDIRYVNSTKLAELMSSYSQVIPSQFTTNGKETDDTLKAAPPGPTSTEVAAMGQEIKNLQKELESLQKVHSGPPVVSTDRALEKAQKDMYKAHDRISHWKDVTVKDINQLFDKVGTLTREQNSLVKDIKDLQRDNNEAGHEIRDLRKRFDTDCKIAVDNFRNEKKSIETKMARFDLKGQQVDEKLKQADERIKRFDIEYPSMAKFQDSLTDLRRSIGKANELTGPLKAQLQEEFVHEVGADELRSSLAALKIHVDELQQESQTMQQDLTAKIGDSVGEVRTMLERYYDEIRDKLVEHASRIESFQEGLARHHQEIQAQESRLSSVQQSGMTLSDWSTGSATSTGRHIQTQMNGGNGTALPSDVVTGLHKRLDVHETWISSLTGRMNNVQSQQFARAILSQLASQVPHVPQVMQELTAMRQSHEHYQNTIKAHTTQLNRMKQQIGTLEQNLKYNIQKVNDEATLRASDATQKVHELKVKMDEVQQEFEVIKTGSEDLSQRLKELEDEYEKVVPDLVGGFQTFKEKLSFDTVGKLTAMAEQLPQLQAVSRRASADIRPTPPTDASKAGDSRSSRQTSLDEMRNNDASGDDTIRVSTPKPRPPRLNSPGVANHAKGQEGMVRKLLSPSRKRPHTEK